MFANPLPGFIHPKGWVRPAGNIEFAVTRTCADHRATNQGCALDIWNARADGKVMAIAPGRVIYRLDLEGIIRIDHGNGDVSAYAHMYPIVVALGQTVTTGQQLGEVGDAHSASIPNFSGPHLHFAIERGGVEIDPWPFLNQNAGGPDMTTTDNATLFLWANGQPAARPVDFLAGPVTGYHLDGTSQTFTIGAGGSWARADARCSIKQSPQIAPNGYPFVRMIDGIFAAGGPWYVVEDGVKVKARPDAPPPVSGGFTQAQLDAAVAKAAMDAKVAAARAGADGAAKAAADFAASLPK